MEGRGEGQRNEKKGEKGRSRRIDEGKKMKQGKMRKKMKVKHKVGKGGGL